MSRCFCCNVILKPSEATRKFKESGAPTEMCNKCLDTISDEGVDTVEGVVEDEELFDDLGNPLEQEE